MKEYNNTIIKNDIVFSKSPSSEGYSFVKYFLERNQNIKSFLDIGCGNGNLLKLMKDKIDYFGVDSDAGIYKNKKKKK